jgi:DNA (cytosine-5)-methyltransferase 1
MFQLIDLFAGPGGLGEGFASLHDGKTFNIAVSAEMEASAHATLTLRSFFRRAKKEDGEALRAYYAFCNSAEAKHPRELHPSLWAMAANEARKLTLGQATDNNLLDKIILEKTLREDQTVLIGGPPCQAYSLVGRSRNMGKAGYIAEKDHRHYLYQEYLRILSNAKPAIFVMENVKGILSAKLDGKLIFPQILHDLSDPGKALGKGTGYRYTIHSLVAPTRYMHGMDPESIDPKSFIINAENYGIPQARHRVILLGVREELKYDGRQLLHAGDPLNVQNALVGLPSLRSKLGHEDSAETWRAAVMKLGFDLTDEALRDKKTDLAEKLLTAVCEIPSKLETGSLRHPKKTNFNGTTDFQNWVRDTEVKVWLNHETRSHMTSDLGRYLYAAVFAQHHGYSPKGHKDFSLKGLAPDHANWETGKFADRFRVQRFDSPSSTVTSHISKDGHYFIHPDPKQCRSLTVREAARLQTFPDNYFFQGNKTQQYHQVGNAVPSLLANKIALICNNILSSAGRAAKKSNVSPAPEWVAECP